MANLPSRPGGRSVAARRRRRLPRNRVTSKFSDRRDRREWPSPPVGSASPDDLHEQQHGRERRAQRRDVADYDSGHVVVCAGRSRFGPSLDSRRRRSTPCGGIKSSLAPRTTHCLSSLAGQWPGLPSIPDATRMPGSARRAQSTKPPASGWAPRPLDGSAEGNPPAAKGEPIRRREGNARRPSDRDTSDISCGWHDMSRSAGRAAMVPRMATMFDAT
jgi:hypothetical protein